MNFCVFPALWQDGLAARPAVVTVDAPSGGRGAGSGHFCWHLDALLPSVALERMSIGVSCWRRRRLRLRDQPQNLLEHLPWNGDLGHLEGDIAAWLTTFAPILISFSSGSTIP